jgi:hypothetical protein
VPDDDQIDLVLTEACRLDRHPPERHLVGHRIVGGAALVEAAFVAPIFLLIVFGVFEFSGMIGSYNGSSHTIRAGARVLSAAANDPMADQMALRRMAVESAGLGEDEIDLIVVWHANSTSESVPNGCVPSSNASVNTSSVGVSDGGTDALGACNVYIRPGAPGGAFDMASGEAASPASYYFGCTGASDPLRSHKVDCRWPALNRKAVTTPRGVTPTQTPDLIGVYIKATHQNVTGFFGESLTITDKTVSQLEPQTYKLS